MNNQRDILLISKDSTLRSVGTVMLEIVGYSVHTASSMRDALAILSAESIGLIVCGLELDDISAIDFITYLKKDPLRETIPFVFYIHKKSQVDLPHEQAINLGAAEVILYPGAPDDFIGRIGKLLPSAIDSGEKPKPDAAGAIHELPAVDDGCVFISIDGQMWAECKVTYHTYHGVMVETRIRGHQGNTVRLCYGMPDGPLTATGRLNHILKGDHEHPTGIGINFKGDKNWHKIQFQMKSAAAMASLALSPADDHEKAPSKENTEAADTGQRVVPDVPIGIEVSRDGALWMFGEISEYDRTGASITTPVLGKKGETLHIRMTLPGGKTTLTAHITKVTLNDFKMPAGMDIIFSGKDQWTAISEDFAGDKGGDAPSKNILDAQAQAPPEVTEEPAAAEAPKKTGATTDAPDKKKTQTTENIKHRFYISLIGKKLGNYEIASFLSAGSMGGVFKGWDIALERDVAIKVISYELSSQKEYVEMFFKEARLVSKLNHPNIAHIYFIGNETGIVYYTMEFIHGCTLAELIAKTDRLQPERAVAYLIDICKALDRVSLEKIIHRDIKPANIMISEHEAVKLLDFGVAQKQKIGATRSKEKVPGTPPYMSPESIKMNSVDFRSDIYSLGATFYHALCGVPPFSHKTIKGVLFKHLNETPVPLAKRQPSITPQISDVIQKMLAKNPNDRFQSYQGIINALSSDK